MNTLVHSFLTVLLGLTALGCATTRAVDETNYPFDPWYADLRPLSKDRMNDWALFDLSYPTLPNLRERSSNPLYDLEVLFK